MGFYPLETIKQDARKFGVDFYNPDINHSQNKCTVDGKSLLIGLEFVKNIGIQNSKNIIDERSGGIGVIGRVYSAIGQFPQEPCIDGAKEEIAIFCFISCAFNIIQQPFNFGAGKIGVNYQAGFLRKLLFKSI